MLGPHDHLLVGIEPDDEEGLTRLYLDHRSRGVYVVVGEAGAMQAKAEWAFNQHTYLYVPADVPRYHEDDAALDEME